MSKELEALERIKHKLSSTKANGYWEELDIIETALKDYEMEHTLRIRLENINYELVREKEESEKKLKALEIIKKEIGGCLEFYYDEEHDYGEVWCVQNEEESRVLIASANNKEEYDLLKEVLL